MYRIPSLLDANVDNMFESDLIIPQMSSLFGDGLSFDVFEIQLPQTHIEDFSSYSNTMSCGCCGCGQKAISEMFSQDGDVGGKSGLFTAEILGPLFMDSVPGDASTTATISIGGSVSGTRETGTDSDWFQVELVAGETYNFFMVRDGANPHTDPRLRLIDPDGVTEIINNDDFDSNNDGAGDNTNSGFSYTATETGTFYLAAEGWNSTSTGDYTIYANAGTERPDFTLDESAFFLTHQFNNAGSWNKTNLTYDVSSLPAAVQALAIAAMNLWADVSGLTFTAVASGGTADITFIDTEDGAYASTSRAGGVIGSATVNVSQSDWIDTYGTDFNSYSFQTYIHEVGHALGLGHGGTYNGGANYTEHRLYNQDAWNYTVMSYFDQGEAGNGTPRLVLGLQMVDILAIQSLYGVAANTRSGDTVYGFNSNAGGMFDFEDFDNMGIRPPSLSIYDSGGVDTLDMSGYSAHQTISLVEETFSSIGDNTNTSDPTDALVNVISVARDSVIENAIGGSGDDTITGNDVSNILTGGLGDDILDGGDGIDYANYATGVLSDYTVTDNMDGTFTIAHATYGTDTLSNIEFLRINGTDHALVSAPAVPTSNDDNLTGTPLADTIDALAGDDVIYGLAGNDRLYGRDGTDELYGGDGNDQLHGGAGADILDGGDGLDRAYYTTSPVGVRVDLLTPTTNTNDAAGDTLISIESIFGSVHNDVLLADHSGADLVGLAGNDILVGRNGRDRLYGGDGDDRLDSGRGNDDMHGNAGADTYVINIGAGRDKVYTWESGVDTIEFRGGPGEFADLDIEIVDGDTVITHFNGVTILVDYAGGLSASDFVFLTPLPDPSGIAVTTNLTGGNDSQDFGIDDDTVNGLAGNDVIRGGIGDDTLNGGDGNDQLFGGLGADVLNGGAGSDRASYTTASSGVTVNMLDTALNTGEAEGDTYIDVENVYGSIYADVLIGDAGDNILAGLVGDDQLVGTDGDDRLYGNEGEDRLTGGRDNDDLFGGDGADTFIFGANSGTDKIYDFEDGLDIIEFQSGPSSIGDLTITYDGTNSLIVYDNRTIELIGFDATTLTAADFVFTNPSAQQPKDVGPAVAEDIDLTGDNALTDSFVSTEDQALIDLFQETAQSSLGPDTDAFDASMQSFYDIWVDGILA